jgi:hypothetical protein
LQSKQAKLAKTDVLVIKIEVLNIKVKDRPTKRCYCDYDHTNFEGLKQF